jgi:hypothetical protein
LGSILISRVSPEDAASLTALTTTDSPSFTRLYRVCRAIFLKVSGFQPAGGSLPSASAENGPTSRTDGDWAWRDPVAAMASTNPPTRLTNTSGLKSPLPFVASILPIAAPAAGDGLNALDELDSHQILGLLVAKLSLDPQPNRRAVLDRKTAVSLIS